MNKYIRIGLMIFISMVSLTTVYSQKIDYNLDDNYIAEGRTEDGSI